MADVNIENAARGEDAMRAGNDTTNTNANREEEEAIAEMERMMALQEQQQHEDLNDDNGNFNNEGVRG